MAVCEDNLTCTAFNSTKNSMLMSTANTLWNSVVLKN